MIIPYREFVFCTLLFTIAIATADAAEHNGLLLSQFVDPPASTRPWIYWFWSNGNLTREGITADLESMQRVGIGGVLIMNVEQGVPQGTVDYGSPEWKEMFQFACSEAKRLGMQVNINNDAGWCGSGGPWNTPEKSMQKVVWTETTVQGPIHFDGSLQEPEKTRDFYRDIAVLAFPTPSDDSYRIPDIRWKAVFETKSALQDFPSMPLYPPSVPPEQHITRDRIVNLTPDWKEGRLLWDVPEGRWTILRLGHTSTGMENHPAPSAGMGLECDKLTSDAVEGHFAMHLGKIIADVGSMVSTTLVSTHIDSWESAAQNWSSQFREEFRKRRRYDPLVFLPVLMGRVVDTSEISERFLWDFRQTLNELLLDNYAERFRCLANQNGLRLSIEAYDNDFCDNLAYAGRADEPMAEFWCGYDPNYPGSNTRSWGWCANTSSAAHIYGKRIVAAEAFTATWDEKWLDYPATIKTLGDWAFCEGINRFVFHRFAMQPWLDRRPGMTMGYWGLHYERTQTWWEMSKPWHDYLARCQYLLRQGLFVADLCYLQPEGAPMRFLPPKTSSTLTPPDRPGYNYDGCTAEVLLNRMTVKDGRLVLPDGMSYSALVLPEPGLMPGALTMTPQLLSKIAELVEAGAMVIGPRPIRSPSLENYPACDREIKRLTDRLWGDCDPRDTLQASGKSGVRRVGKGVVRWGISPETALSEQGIPPDFACDTQPAPVRYVHRKTEDGTNLYFVANKNAMPTNVTCTFRIPGICPELWWPETGRIENPAVYDEIDGRMVLPLHLESAESVFVVFRPNVQIEPDRITAVTELTAENAAKQTGNASITLVRNGNELLATVDQPGKYHLQAADGKSRIVEVKTIPAPISIDGGWELRFPQKSGAPTQVRLDGLISWSKHPDPEVKYYSGTATYCKEIDLPPEMFREGQRLYLDLGVVAVMARVKLNGKDLGIQWKSPFRVEITDSAIAGKNALEIAVVNLWPNRMIGDEQLPEDSERDANGTLKSWPQWLVEGKPSPTNRRTFTTWRPWKKDDPLLDSGLLGPVRIVATQTVNLNAQNQ